MSSEALEVCRRGVRNVLAHLGVLDGAPQPAAAPEADPRIARNSRLCLRALRRAFSRPCIRSAPRCSAGEPGGRIHRVWEPGHEPETIAYGCDGVLLARRQPGRVKPGNCCLVVASPCLERSKRVARITRRWPALPVRVLIAGAGAFGTEHLGRLAERSDVASGWRRRYRSRRARAASARATAPANCLADPLRLIDEVAADAIIVATPAASHVEICVRALARNLCVLMEKPVAPSAADGAPLLHGRGARAPAFVLPGHVLRFSKDHVRLVEIVRSGRIGKVIYVNSRRYRDDSHALRYPDADPVLMTLIHDIDLAQWVTGSAFRSVLARRSGGQASAR